MNEKDIAEQAYKNGYEQGKAELQKQVDIQKERADNLYNELMQSIKHLEEYEKQIERLTEEKNDWEKSCRMWSEANKKNHLKFTKTLEKLCQERKEKAELQKQVDELTDKNKHLDSENTRLICEMDKMLDEGWDIMDEEADGWYKKGVKDTAKEILQSLYDACKDDDYGQVVLDYSNIESLAKQFGVEVE